MFGANFLQSDLADMVAEARSSPFERNTQRWTTAIRSTRGTIAPAARRFSGTIGITRGSPQTISPTTTNRRHHCHHHWNRTSSTTYACDRGSVTDGSECRCGSHLLRSLEPSAVSLSRGGSRRGTSRALTAAVVRDVHHLCDVCNCLFYAISHFFLLNIFNAFSNH